MSPRLILLTGMLAAVLAIAAGLYWKGRHDGSAHERPKIEAATAKAAVASLETDGARATTERVEVVVRQRQAAADAISQLTAKALTSEDAHAPIDPARADRMRDTDIELCVVRPTLMGCAEDRDAR